MTEDKDSETRGSEGRDIRTVGAPDFEPHIEEMLKKAGIKSTPSARSSLVSYLHLTFADTDLELSRKRGAAEFFEPRDLLEQLDDSIEETQQLLQRLEKLPHLRGISKDRCAVVGGIVDPLPLKPWFDEVPPGASIVVIDRQRILQRLRRDIARHNPKRKRGWQREPHKVIVIARAASFFREHSTEEPTTYSGGPFVKFCRRFYEVVTGMPLRASGLQKLIREELKKPTFETQMPEET
jgi:hypothetical protein